MLAASAKGAQGLINQSPLVGHAGLVPVHRPLLLRRFDRMFMSLERRLRRVLPTYAVFEAGLKNPVLEHGDIIDVPRAAYCYIHGEVRSPGRIPIERETTLLKAITLVGGLVGDQRSSSAAELVDPSAALE